VLDSDGRRVSTLNLLGKGDAEPDSARIAAWLKESLDTKPQEWFHLRVPPDPKGRPGDFGRALRELDGVNGIQGSEGSFLVQADSGRLSPEKILEAAGDHGVEVRIVDPVPVGFAPRKGQEGVNPAEALTALPGVWTVSGGKPPRVWVSRFLLDPKILARGAPGLTFDVEARNFTLPGVSASPTALRGATAVLRLKGIVAFFPAFYSEGATVVGRKGEVSWSEVLEALRKHVEGAREEK
jgi:hypothetical protein